MCAVVVSVLRISGVEHQRLAKVDAWRLTNGVLFGDGWHNQRWVNPAEHLSQRLEFRIASLDFIVLFVFGRYVICSAQEEVSCCGRDSLSMSAMSCGPVGSQDACPCARWLLPQS